MAVVENDPRCGLLGGIFRRRIFPSKSKSLPSTPRKSAKEKLLQTGDTNSKKHPNGAYDVASARHSSFAKHPPSQEEVKSIKRPAVVNPRTSVPSQGRKSVDVHRSSSSSNGSNQTKASQGQELANPIAHEHQQSNGNMGLLRATSGNIMALGHLSNLKPLAMNHSKNVQEKVSFSTQRNGNLIVGGNGGGMGNIVRVPSYEPTNRRDPELLKCMGNEEFNKGKYEEALILYDRAVNLDSSKGSYHYNKAAALAGLERLIDAVFECREAIRIEPYYPRAHYRLATLYLRLGEAEKALSHYKYSSSKEDSEQMAQAKAIQTHLSNCTQAQKLRDWRSLLKETQIVISSGADSAPQIYALQAEALLRLHRHQEAFATFKKGQKFGIKSCIEFFGTKNSAYILMIQAQLYMALGRLEDAEAGAQHAARLDSTNKEISLVLRRIQAVSSARAKGNQLFREAKFSEACSVYGEGLENDPYNSILLCNRAACRLKLGQFEKALEDCNAALNVQPSYGKARLRRATCNSKLERWAASIEDYEMLIRETPGDEEVARALFEARLQLKKLHGEDIKDMKFGSNLASISSNDQFRHLITSPGMTVVLFCNKSCQKQVLQLEQVCKRFPSVNFLKVEVEDHPYLSKSEGVSSNYIPVFKIYKNGSMVKEIPGNNTELFEHSIKMYSS